MSKIWVTSDTHFNHLNILAYEPRSRPFASVAEMNEVIINNWNSVVSPEDEVIHCGDFFMGNISEIGKILPRLNGKITLVRGNHDTPARVKKYEDCGIAVKDIHYLPYKGRYFIFCHFPITNEEFMRMVREDNSEVILCYGHIHSNAPIGLQSGTFHVGVDTNNLTPVNLHYIWQLSREEEDKRNIPPIDNEICKKCGHYMNKMEYCKGQDGGCLHFISK